MRHGLVCCCLLFTLATIAGAQSLISTAPTDNTPNNHPAVAYLGVAISPLDRRHSIKTGLPVGVGLKVEWVDTQTNTEQKIKKGDILHKLNNQILISAKQLQVLVNMHQPGDAIELTRWRDGKAAQVSVTLGKKKKLGKLPDAPHHPVYTMRLASESDRNTTNTTSGPQGAITTVSAKQNIRCTLQYLHKAQRFLVHDLNSHKLLFDSKPLSKLSESNIPEAYLIEYKKIRTLEPHVRPSSSTPGTRTLARPAATAGH